MALSSTLVWQVDSSGSGSNGGGFDPAAPNAGTDYSQLAVIAFSNLTISATNTAQITNTGTQFNATHIGNVIQITSGAGFTTGFYEILNVGSGGVATLDRSVGVASSSGGVGNVGGSLAAMTSIINTVMVAGNTVFVKVPTAGAQGVLSALTPPSGVGPTQPTRIIGYQTNRTILNADSPVPVNPTANSITIFSLSTSNVIVRNFSISNPSLNTGITAFSVSGSNVIVEQCRANGVVTGFLATGVGANQVYFINCNALTCSSVGFQTATTCPAGAAFLFCIADGCGTAGNSFAGFSFGSQVTCAYCLAINNIGPGFDTNTNTQADCIFHQCDAYNNANASFGYGFIVSTGSVQLINCISSGNSIGDYRDNIDATPNYLSRYVGCAGTINTPVTIVNTANLIGFQTLTTSPWNNPTGKDFSLNTTAGGGAACRSGGQPTSYLGLNTSAFFDIGAAEHTQVLAPPPVFAAQVAPEPRAMLREAGRVVIAGRGGVFGATPRQTITQVNASTGVNNNTTANLTVPFSSSAMGQDLIIVVIASRTIDHTPITVVDNNPGGGWNKFFEFSTLAGGPNSLTLSGFYAFKNVNTVGKFISSPVTGINGFVQQAVAVYYRNVDPSQPIDAISSGVSSIGASANTLTVPSVTTIIDQDKILIAAGDWDGGSLLSTYGGLGGFSGSPAVNMFGLAALFTPPGATGTTVVTDTFGSGDPNQILSAIRFALRPAPFVLTPVDIYKIVLTEKLPPQEPEVGFAFSSPVQAPTVSPPYVRAVVASEDQVYRPDIPYPGATRAIVGVVSTTTVQPRTLVAGYPEQSHQLAAQLQPGSTFSESASTVPIVPYRPIIQATVQRLPDFEPDSGEAIIGQVYPPSPTVKTPPAVVASQVVPPSSPEAGVVYIYPAWWNKVPPYPNLYSARIVELPPVDREGGRVSIGQVFPPVPTVKTPLPVTASQVTPPQIPEPGSARITPYGGGTPIVPLQTPIQAVVATQEYPHNQVEPGRAIFRGVGVVPTPQQTYVLSVVGYQTTPPQYDQGSAFSAPNPDVVPSVSARTPNPPGVFASQVAPPFVPEEKKPQSVVGVVPAFYRPAQPVLAAQSDRDIQPLLSPGQVQFMGRGVVATPSQLYGSVVLAAQTVPAFEPEPGSAFTGGTSLIPQPPPSPPPNAVIAVQVTPPLATFPEPGRIYQGKVTPPPPFVSPFYTTPVSRVEPPFIPERGSAFIFSQAFRFYPFQFSIKSSQETPPPGTFPDPGRVYIGAVVPPPAPIPPPRPVVASQVLPIPAAFPEPGRVIFLGVVLSGPLHPMWVPAQIVQQQTPPLGTFPEAGRAYIGAVVPPVPVVKTPPPVTPSVQVAPPFFPEEGRVFIWKTPPQPSASPPPYPRYGFIVKPDFVPEPGSATSTHAYAPTPIVAPGFVTYPRARVEPPFEPESGSAFSASAGVFVPAPIVPTPPPVVAKETAPWAVPPAGAVSVITYIISPPVTTPGRVIALVDIYAPKIKAYGVVGGS